MNINEVAQLLHSVGFNGQALVWMTAIDMRESGGNPGVYNPNVSTGDNSVGLGQVNILGGNARGISSILQSLGINVSAGDHQGLIAALSDPMTNARVQYVMSRGGTYFEPWRSHSPGWEGPLGFLTHTDVPSAQAAAAQVQMGNMSQNTTQQSQQPTDSAAGQSIVDWLKNNALGKPYVAGTVGPNSFDCSGLVTAVYRSLGINLPPLTFSQVKYGMGVTTDQLQAGDLVFFHGAQGDLGHVGIYIGNGQYIQAPHTGAQVMISTLDPSRVQAARRIIDGNGRLIIGAGLVADHSANVLTVDASQAVLGGTIGNSSLPQPGGVSLDPLHSLGTWGTLNTGTGMTPNGVKWGTGGGITTPTIPTQNATSALPPSALTPQQIAVKTEDVNPEQTAANSLANSGRELIGASPV